MSRTRNGSSASPSSWVGWKDLGHRLYSQKDYPSALTAFAKCLNPIYECPTSEHHLLLSNMVACRLHIGGDEQIAQAIVEAQKIVDLRPAWAKGHVRLATACLMVGGQSNRACQHLQTALRYDPGHPTARQMLVRELQRDRNRANGGNNNDNGGNSGNSNTEENQPPIEEVDGGSMGSGQQPHQRRQGSWVDSISSGIQRLKAWYECLSEDQKAWAKIAFALLVLYVAFGGRFGLEFGNRRTPRGNYNAAENAYTTFRNKQRQYGGGGDHWGQRDYSANEYQYSGGGGSSRNNDYFSSRRSSSSSSQALVSTLDGSSILFALLLMGGIYIMHLNGFSLWQIIVALNVLQGGRGGRGVRFGRRQRFGMFGR